MHTYIFSIQTIKGSEDNPSQYMNFMNAVFSSQKQVSRLCHTILMDEINKC